VLVHSRVVLGFQASFGMLLVLGGIDIRIIISVLLQNNRKAIVNKNISVLEGAVVSTLVFLYRFDNDGLASGDLFARVMLRG